MVTFQKIPGSVGIIFYFFSLSAKPEIVGRGCGIRYFIFEISGKPSFVEAVFYDELRSFSTFFALNFDKKLAVEYIKHCC
jgi:hypothetical protein